MQATLVSIYHFRCEENSSIIFPKLNLLSIPSPHLEEDAALAIQHHLLSLVGDDPASPPFLVGEWSGITSFPWGDGPASPPFLVGG